MKTIMTLISVIIVTFASNSKSFAAEEIKSRCIQNLVTKYKEVVTKDLNDYENGERRVAMFIGGVAGASFTAGLSFIPLTIEVVYSGVKDKAKIKSYKRVIGVIQDSFNNKESSDLNLIQAYLADHGMDRTVEEIRSIVTQLDSEGAICDSDFPSFKQVILNSGL